MTIETMDSSRSEVELGSRVRTEDGSFGTVLYIGAVQGTGGAWLGVEWDSAHRGKHDGEHQGVRYFHAKPGCGSFIRPKKVVNSTTFLKELSDRYGLQHAPNAGVTAEQLFVGDGLGQTTKVEMVGAEKVNRLQSKFENLQIVVLQDCLIRGLEPGVDLKKTVPNIVELNLSKNLLGNWNEVAKIAGQLPKLKILNLSENRLSWPDSVETLAGSFNGLRSLFLNRMDIDFDTVLEWSKMWPQVEDLHVCFNNISVLTHPGENYLKSLKLLNLEGNRLDSWTEVMKLQDIHTLQTLILNSTGLNSINLSNCGKDVFSHLREISLCGNIIGDWSSINELNRIKIKDLKVNGNPLLASDKWETIRDIIVAKIRSLKYLNRTEVTAEERKGAEICYLKRFGLEWLKCGGNSDPSKNQLTPEFLENHPRFPEFIEKYGAPEEAEMNRAPQGLKDSLISVHIKAPNKTITKKLPSSMTVQKLKTMVQKLLKAESSTLTLAIVCQGQGQGQKVEFDNDLRELSFYSLANDDVIEATW